MNKIKICENCKKEFEKPSTCSISDWTKRRFCSRSCRIANSTEQISCKNCSKLFARKTYHSQIFFCSVNCRHDYKRNHPEEYNLFENGHVGYKTTPWLGKKLSEETKTKMSIAQKGKPHSPEHIAKTSGPNHWNWKGGITDEIRLLTSKKEYKDWRDAVYRRDYWTCQICGKKPRKICAHHIKSFRKFPELRYEVSNGQTPCRSCHKKVHEEMGVTTRFIKDNNRISN